MRNTGLVHDLKFLEHETGPMHPERGERLLALEALFSEEEFRGLPRVAIRPAAEEDLARVHSRDHISQVAASADQERTNFDADTTASAGSFDAALHAAGASMALADAIMAGELDNGFAALRPPGHHAEADRPMGFCLFNNVAVVARHLQAVHGLSRVLIVDWDVHHGNGTQHSFYDDPSVMYASLHQFPLYPGTGAVDEVGEGGGAGFTVNLPMPAGSEPPDYCAGFREVLLPIAQRFKPEFVLVSAGFDAHCADPLAGMSLDEEAFDQMTCALLGLADETAGGRLAMLLEGGYDTGALSDSVRAVVTRLRDPQPFDDAEGELNNWGQGAREVLSSYWENI